MISRQTVDSTHRFALTQLGTPGGVPGASFEFSSPSDLWRIAKRACRAALEGGGGLVLIARNAQVLAERRVLSADEQACERRYRRREDRLNFVLGRTLVNRMLRAAGSSMPQPLVLSRHGKPFAPNGPHFNLSHVGGHVACALCRTAPIGVDIETCSRIGDPRALIRAVAHPVERELLESCTDETLTLLFRRCWTRKEAALKAAGVGLRADLPGLNTHLSDVSPVISAPEPVRLVDFWSESHEAGGSVALGPAVPALSVYVVDVDRA